MKSTFFPAGQNPRQQTKRNAIKSQSLFGNKEAMKLLNSVSAASANLGQQDSDEERDLNRRDIRRPLTKREKVENSLAALQRDKVQKEEEKSENFHESICESGIVNNHSQRQLLYQVELDGQDHNQQTYFERFAALTSPPLKIPGMLKEEDVTDLTDTESAIVDNLFLTYAKLVPELDAEGNKVLGCK